MDAEVEQHSERPAPERSARTAEVIGAVAGSLGPPAAVAGGLWVFSADWNYDEVGEAGGGAVLGLGLAGTFAGPPLLLGASMRERRLLEGRGVHASGAAGAVGWSLFGASMAAEVALWIPLFGDGPYAGAGWYLVPVAPYAGAIVAGLVQRGENAHAAREAGETAGSVGSGGPQWWVAPQLGRSAGLTIGASF